MANIFHKLFFKKQIYHLYLHSIPCVFFDIKGDFFNSTNNIKEVYFMYKSQRANCL